jgi:hypothetical protein
MVLAVALAGAPEAGAREAGAGCDPLDPARCLLPWPNDHFTRPDAASATGRRLALRDELMPRNAQGVPIAAADYNASDGFSPGQTIVTKVPGLDTPEALRRTGAVPVTDLARAYDRRQPVVVVDARTHRRHLVWAELDANAHSAADTALLIHPAVNFREGRRYVVALRDLRGADGRRLRAGAAFRRYRDRIHTRSAAFERRRPHMEEIFRTLRRAGVSRRSLYLAWDFTVASGRSLAERMLSIRDRAFAALDDRDLADLLPAGRPPAVAVDAVTDYTPAEQPHVARRVEGRVTVPCYLDRPGCPPGSRFRLGPRGLPVRTPGNTTQARFICNIPRSATPAAPARPSLYGHGLFGDAGEVRADNVEQLGDENGVLVCASDWIGMSEEDLPNALALLQDLSRFPSLPDRLQQGFVNFLYLGRALIHPSGLAAHDAFRRDGQPLIDTRRLFYYGNSQGGIAGGALTAVAPDFTRAVLYVGAMNYSLLLDRSVDFDPFAAVLAPSYPDPLERPLIISLLQVLWDRGEPNGYAWHLTRDPYPNTPRHRVLQLMAFGDHQVANVATEVQARTIGARLRRPALDPGRSPDRRPFFAIPRLRRLPYDGNALVVWDIGPLRPAGCGLPDAPACLGTPAPPTTNTPPRLGVDPHDLVIESEARARRQIAEFLEIGGRVIEVCGDDPCRAAGWTGP